MATKHSPGPWEVKPIEADKNYLRIRGTVLGGPYKIANVHAEKHLAHWPDLQVKADAEAAANARLIAAAPDLLAALQVMLNPNGFWPMAVRLQALDAIAKATGEPHA